MRENDFEIFLNKEPSISSGKSIERRLRYAKEAEKILNEELDVIVKDDDTMNQALEKLKNSDSKEHSHLQNILRKYYKFSNGKEFPKLKDYQ